MCMSVNDSILKTSLIGLDPKMEFLNLPAREPYRQNEIFPDSIS